MLRFTLYVAPLQIDSSNNKSERIQPAFQSHHHCIIQLKRITFVMFLPEPFSKWPFHYTCDCFQDQAVFPSGAHNPLHCSMVQGSKSDLMHKIKKIQEKVMRKNSFGYDREKIFTTAKKVTRGFRPFDSINHRTEDIIKSWDYLLTVKHWTAVPHDPTDATYAML